MKKNLLLTILVLSVLMATFAIADIGETISDVLDIGRLDWLFGSSPDNQVIGFIRILMAILIFSIIYLGLSAANEGMGGNAIPQGIAITIGILLSILTSIFLPGEVLMMFGETYATIFALIIIGGPILGLLALCFLTPTNSSGVAFLKFLAICFTMWLISKISVWADKLASVTGVL
jgi:hypothetical protein